MKVKELIEQLQDFDPEQNVYIDVNDPDAGMYLKCGDLTFSKIQASEDGVAWVEPLTLHAIEKHMETS